MTSPNRDAPVTGVQREFPHVWNGYDRARVDEYLSQLEETLQRLANERNAALGQHDGLTKQLDKLRAENGELIARVEELTGPPKNLDDLDQRMRRVGKLAYLQAEEINARAQAATEENWKATAKASIALRERYRSLLKELDAHAEALHAEHRAALEETRAEVQELMVDAVRRRDALDQQAERKRRAIEQEFDKTMASQKAELEKYIADQRMASKNQAERRLAEAAAEARRIIAKAKEDSHRRKVEADGVVEQLAAIGGDARGRLKAADEQLAQAAQAIEPTEDEQLPAPRAEDGDEEQAADASGNGRQPSPRPHAAAE